MKQWSIESVNGVRGGDYHTRLSAQRAADRTNQLAVLCGAGWQGWRPVQYDDEPASEDAAEGVGRDES